MNQAKNPDSPFQDFLRDMSPDLFKMLGVHHIAYIKEKHHDHYELRAANGDIIEIFSTLKGAIEETKEQDLKPVTLH